MIKNQIRTIIRLTIILGLLLSFTSSEQTSVGAAPAVCTWHGDVNSNWYNQDNWDCLKYPTSEDDVVIPSDGVTHYPILTSGVSANTILIETDGQLTSDAISIIPVRANSFINNGTINIIDRPSNVLRIYGGTFNNNGTINIGNFSSNTLILEGAGSHTGTIKGNKLNFNLATARQQNTFSSTSSIEVYSIYVLGNHDVDIDGSVYVKSDFLIRNNSTVTVSTSGIVDLGNVTVEDTSQLIYRIAGGSYNPGESMILAQGETLSGEGTIQADLTNAGTLRPGSSPGTITIGGDFTQLPAGILEIELGGTEPGVSHDQLVINGTADLDGSLTVHLIDPFIPSLNDNFTIVTYGSHSGRFNNLDLPALTPGLGWKIEYNNQSIVLVVVQTASLSGTVTYIGDKGFNPVTIGLFADPNGPPIQSVNVSSTTGTYPYTFSDLVEGNYYIGALMDLNGSDDPDPDEPFAWYGNGNPQLIHLIPPDSIEDLDITLKDPYLQTFIPLIIR